MGGPKISAPVKAVSPAPVEEVAPAPPPADVPAPPPADRPKMAAPRRVGALFVNGLLPHQRRALTVWAQANHVQMELIEEPSNEA